MKLSRNKDRIETSLRMLDSFGFSTALMWTELRDKLEAESNAAPRPDDLLYELPEDVRMWQDRVSEAASGTDSFPIFSSSNAYEGWQYELTPGQRDWLRGNFNMTPAKQVVVQELARWVGTRHPKELVLVSCEHVNPALRRNTLVMARITNAGTFFKESLALDKAREEGKKASASSAASKPTKVAPNLDAMMAELEKEFA